MGNKKLLENFRMRKNWAKMKLIAPWGKNLQRTQGRKKQMMIKYCCFIWAQGPILRPAVFWPKCGSNEEWVCQLLI
jgi:hypothetical protein